MQATVASLFDLNLEDVPHFISFGDRWYEKFYNFFEDRGYKCSGNFYNIKYSSFLTPTADCFKITGFVYDMMLSEYNLDKNGGINGYYLASVLSPKYFNYNDGFLNTHSVIVDKMCRIVHDPNPAYQDILKYPLADLFGYNGVIHVDNFKKI